MSALAVALFSALQDADFYRALHADAVDLLPVGAGRTWLDVGCGPGVLARMAAERGYDVLGVDSDPLMIRRARKIARERDAVAAFEVADLDSAVRIGARYDVVSASSLLAVMRDPAAELRQILALTNPEGVALVIEADAHMSRWRAHALASLGSLGRRAFMLPVWAWARSGRTVPAAVFESAGWVARRHPLLHGMANAWLMGRVAQGFPIGAGASCNGLLRNTSYG